MSPAQHGYKMVDGVFRVFTDTDCKLLISDFCRMEIVALITFDLNAGIYFDFSIDCVTGWSVD